MLCRQLLIKVSFSLTLSDGGGSVSHATALVLLVLLFSCGKVPPSCCGSQPMSGKKHSIDLIHRYAVLSDTTNLNISKTKVDQGAIIPAPTILGGSTVGSMSISKYSIIYANHLKRMLLGWQHVFLGLSVSVIVLLNNCIDLYSFDLGDFPPSAVPVLQPVLLSPP